MRAPKFNFVPENQLTPVHGNVEYRVTLQANGQIAFNSETVTKAQSLPVLKYSSALSEHDIYYVLPVFNSDLPENAN